jgi:hypothetical protein
MSKSNVGMILLSCFFFPPAQALGEIARKPLDGNWWKGVSSEERMGSLFGIVDCLTYEASPPVLIAGKFAVEAQKISHKYEIGVIPSSTLAIDALLKGHEVINKLPEGAERYGNGFWRQNSDDARRGFIEGYISCMKYVGRSTCYSPTTDVYVEKLNQVYNANDRNGMDAPEYDGPVAAAIEKVNEELTIGCYKSREEKGAGSTAVPQL